MVVAVKLLIFYLEMAKEYLKEQHDKLRFDLVLVNLYASLLCQELDLFCMSTEEEDEMYKTCKFDFNDLPSHLILKITIVRKSIKYECDYLHNDFPQYLGYLVLTR